MNKIFKPLFIWFGFLLIILTGIFWSFYLGIPQLIYSKDLTMITSWEAFTFFLALSLIGIYAKTSRVGFLEHAEWLAEQEMGLGLVGTGIGFIILLTQGGLSTVDAVDTTSIINILKTLPYGLGTALYTNALGVGSSLILRWIAKYVSLPNET